LEILKSLLFRLHLLNTRIRLGFETLLDTLLLGLNFCSYSRWSLARSSVLAFCMSERNCACNSSRRACNSFCMILCCSTLYSSIEALTLANCD
jgi:hypothetical protein